MKKIAISLFLSSALWLNAQNVGINNANLTPDPSAGLDINYTDKGLLIPRVSLTGTTDVTTIPGAATSLLVYNTATVSDVTPGYYYWDGTQWVRLISGTLPTPSNDWTTTGNSGTTAGTNFLGTTDAQDLVFKTNNTEYLRLTTTGLLGLNTSTPGEAFTIGNNNLVFHNGGNKAIGFETDYSGGTWNKNTTSNYQGRIEFDPNSGRIFFTTSATNAISTNTDNHVSILPNGNVGIGTSAPSTDLEINGQIKITGGSPGAGKVLTSDATGLATWQTPSTSILLTVSYPYGQSAATNTFTAGNPPVTIASFTAPSDGLYMITAKVTVNIGGGQYGDYSNFNQNSQTYFRLTGGGTTASEEHLSEDATKQISIAYLFPLTAGDVVTFDVEQQNASTFGFSGLEMRVVKF